MIRVQSTLHRYVEMNWLLVYIRLVIPFRSCREYRQSLLEIKMIYTFIHREEFKKQAIFEFQIIWTLVGYFSKLYLVLFVNTDFSFSMLGTVRFDTQMFLS